MRIYLTLITALFCTAFSVRAAGEIKDVVLGETMYLNYTDPKYRFVPEESGFLHIETDSWSDLRGSYNKSNILYCDESCNVPMTLYIAPILNENGRTYVFQVEAGAEYYLSIDFVFKDHYTFTMWPEEPELAIVYIDPLPNENTVYPLMAAPVFELQFNYFDLDCDGARLRYQTDTGEKVRDLYIESSLIDMSWFVNIWSGIQEVRSEILDGSVFKIEIVKPVLRGEPIETAYSVNGNLVFPFRYKPLTNLVSEKWPKTFLSWWNEGDDDGTAVITFDAPLAKLEDQKSLTYNIYGGNDRMSENGMPELAAPEFTIDGNSIIMNFQGVRRDCIYDLVSVFVQRIIDANGMSVNYKGSGSIFMEIPYKMWERIVPGFEFTPGDNGDISSADEIELWFENTILDNMELKGFEFDAEGDKVNVEIADCRQEPDSFNPGAYSLVYIPVPDAVRKASNVKLSAILNTFDGYDYDISVSYTNEDSGVGVIGTETAKYEVYSLQGVKVLETPDKSALRNLPAGIYIVNGKKEVISNR